MKLIGLTGLKRSGKDTMYNYIKEKINQDVISLAFAKPLKDICKIVFDLSEEQLYGNLKEEEDERYGITPRVIMQKVGTELFRNKFSEVFPELNYDKNIWIKTLENQLKKYKNTEKIIFITDVRFKNEYDLVKKHNGIIINIEREGLENKDSHISENELKNEEYDYKIKNENLEDYYKKIRELYNKIK